MPSLLRATAPATSPRAQAPQWATPTCASATISRGQTCTHDAGPSEGASSLCWDGLGLQGICPEKGNSFQTQWKATAHPVSRLLLYLQSVNKLRLHLWLRWSNPIPQPALLCHLKGKKNTTQITFITLDRAKHLASTSLRLGSGLWLATTPFTPHWLLRIFHFPSQVSPTCCSSVGVEAPCPGAGSLLTKPWRYHETAWNW